jgi:acylaminoacyl-peptidase
MFEMSPVHYIDHVTTPTMICLGLKDRRVPASQGIEYFKLLTAKGIKSKLLQFPEDVHAIDKPCSEAEHFVAMCSWFREHVK